jgi:glucose-1-phosphate thymidylyltransferase
MVPTKHGMGKTMHQLGIILAGGKSSRLYPATLSTTKQLLPVYDKPLIYYPLTTLMLAGVRDFVIITSPDEKSSFERLFADAHNEMGVNIRILVQEKANGIAEAFKIVARNTPMEKLLEYDSTLLILGDNIFYGAGLRGMLTTTLTDTKNAHIFLYPTKTPEQFGVAEVKDNKVISIVEKPTKPKSNLAVTGLYVYPPSVYLYAELLVPSARGELEITDLNMHYLHHTELHAVTLSRGTVWFDTGNAESLLEASNFVHHIQKHQSYLIGSPHEVAINSVWVTKEQIQSFITKCIKTEYGKYLQNLLG